MRRRSASLFSSILKILFPTRGTPFKISPKQAVQVVFLAGLLGLSLLTTHHYITPTTAAFSGRVIHVVDGDTLDMLSPNGQKVRIRMAEIDAPERKQPFGEESLQALNAMAMGRDAVAQIATTDAYGRSVAHVFVGGKDLNAEMIRGGFAWVYEAYSVDDRLIELEDEAKDSRQGLWALPAGQRLPPWEWRHKNKKK
ncbi:MAG: thermonuclease family protein [Bdellovibrionales bacterium]